MMGWMGLSLITFLIFIVWYFFFSSYGLNHERILDRWIASGVLTAGQISLSEIALGHFGFLTLGWVLFLNLGISVGVFGFLFAHQRFKISVFLCFLKDMVKSIPNGWRTVKGWENGIILGLFFLLFFLLGLSAYLLPPRAFDDVYHLPPVFQYLKDSKISILPVQIRSQFAYPQNGEFLFLWPLFFVQDARMVNIVQPLFVIFGVFVLYRLSTCWGANPRKSFFVSMLFPFVPVVSGQAASSNIDLIASVFFLVTMLFAVHLWQKVRITYFYLAGISMGFILGMKYSFLLFGLCLQPLIFYSLWKGFREGMFKYSLLYLGLVFLFGGYWYLRNWWVFGNPVWPFPV